VAERVPPPVLDAGAVDAALAWMPAWRRDGQRIVASYRCAGFAGAIELVVAVAALAEAADHHPDIDIRWDTVNLSLATHESGGITRRDLDLAAAIDQLGAGAPAAPDA
jgi:4a-hydroxytetrahydrobiopterin dehydratase